MAQKAPGQSDAAVAVGVEPEIGWQNYARIAPDKYFAYCRWARVYWDPAFRRWTCLLRFNVLSHDLLRPLVCVPMWLSLSQREKPHAGRRSRYFTEWIRANGMAPDRRDRLSPKVFVHRMARVEIDDTTGDAPYSVVRKIIEWQTGHARVTQSASHTVKDGIAQMLRERGLVRNE